MSQETLIREFQITFDGAKIRNGEIDVRVLADSLIYLNDALERSNKLLNGKNADIAVKIKAEMVPGSFKVYLVNIIDYIAEVGASERLDGLKSVCEFLGVCGVVRGTKSLFSLLREIRGRKVVSNHSEEDGSKSFVLDDGTKIAGINKNVSELFEDSYVRHSVGEMANIINNGHVDQIIFNNYHGNESENNISVGNAKFFKAPESSVLAETDTDKYLLVSVANILGYPSDWKFKEDEDGKDFMAFVADDAFLDEIKARKIILKSGDMLKVKLRTIQSRPRKNLKTDYTVLRVLEYIPYGDDSV